jgi:phosphoribosylglycinamide formyltransferase-1
MTRLKLAVLISGRGSNLQALIDAATAPDYPAAIALVLSNRPDAAGLERAREAGIATAVVDHKRFAERAPFDAEIDRTLRAHGIELVCLAGFMRLLTRGFVEAWTDRMINIHPSLLPAFKGLHTHARALAAGVKFAGCTVHFVRPEMDEGPIIVQAAVPILPTDDEAGLAARVLVAEHRCYPLAVRWIAEGRARIDGNRVAIEGGAAPPGSLVNPAA